MHSQALVNPEKLKYADLLRANMTPTEKTLWLHLKWYFLLGYKFEAQKVLYGYIADFFCNRVSLIIEVDGEYHDSAEQRERDKVRDEHLRGYTILRFKRTTVKFGLFLVLPRIWYQLLIDD